MDYLKICQMYKQHHQNRYCGLIVPKKYSSWSQTTPQILFFEGIHQFSVRAARSEYIKENGGVQLGIKYVPVQVKNLQVFDECNYEDIKIEGTVLKQDSIYKVDFEVFGKNQKKGHKYATGTVYVSCITYNN